MPGVDALLGEAIVQVRTASDLARKDVHTLIGWGLRPSTTKPRAIASKHGLPFISLEDGFLRSFGTGREHPALSLVVDPEGIYYAAGRPSALESLLASQKDVLKGDGACYAEARQRIVSEGLSKYNSAPDIDPSIFRGDGSKVLVVDQTVGDSSVENGLATSGSFALMLTAARAENPNATIYVKTHPEVSGGKKRGYLSDAVTDGRTIMLREPASPASVLRHIDRAYVVTSHMGFEALLHGVSVTCFGMPWYAGWGSTDDRISIPQRNRIRTVDELFSAAYLHYTRYLNPETHNQGTIFDVIDWLSLQRRMHSRETGRTIAIGYRRWKAENIKYFLGHSSQPIHFVPDAAAAEIHKPTQHDRFVIWGASPSLDLKSLAKRTATPIHQMEDGFIRSVGLGSDFIPPQSLIIDKSGLYFDSRKPSDLEKILNTVDFTSEDHRRARIVRDLIVRHKITKYNIEPSAEPAWKQAGRPVVLVPGQVEDDASIRFGTTQVSDNLSLLKAARSARPDAYLVYKPHPDVTVRNRKGRIHRNQALLYADAIETDVSIVSCIEAADEVHTMTSLSGFDALLRDKRVVVYGTPFYAGWGLTSDRTPIPRRNRNLAMEDLVAGTLLHYPIYWDWVLRGFTTCEATLLQIIHRHNHLLETGSFASVRKTYAERQLHKLKLWLKSGFLLTR